MDKLSCQQIDNEFLVEEFVAGKLTGELLERFEQHISECAEHARAVSLERVLRRGVREYARTGIKSRILKRVKKREDIRLMVLRFAAFLFVAVVTPLILYYQFGFFHKDNKIQKTTDVIKKDQALKSVSSMKRKTSEISAKAGAEKSTNALGEEIAAKPESKESQPIVHQPKQMISENEVNTGKAEEPQSTTVMEQEDRSQVHALDLAATKAKQAARSQGSLMVSADKTTGTVSPTLSVFGPDNTLHPEIADKILPQIDGLQLQITKI